eukprot:7292408-Pyramimonas_sp.AAC.1
MAALRASLTCSLAGVITLRSTHMSQQAVDNSPVTPLIQLQRWNQRVRERWPVAARACATWSDGEGEVRP